MNLYSGTFLFELNELLYLRLETGGGGGKEIN